MVEDLALEIGCPLVIGQVTKKKKSQCAVDRPKRKGKASDDIDEEQPLCPQKITGSCLLSVVVCSSLV